MAAATMWVVLAFIPSLLISQITIILFAIHMLLRMCAVGEQVRSGKAMLFMPACHIQDTMEVVLAKKKKEIVLAERFAD